MLEAVSDTGSAPALEAVANAMAALARTTGPLGIAVRGLFDNLGRLASYAAGARLVYVATADYEPTQQAIAILATAIRDRAPAGVTWTYEPMPHEHHNTIYPTAALHGIRLVFAAK